MFSWRRKEVLFCSLTPDPSIYPWVLGFLVGVGFPGLKQICSDGAGRRPPSFTTPSWSFMAIRHVGRSDLLLLGLLKARRATAGPMHSAAFESKDHE